MTSDEPVTSAPGGGGLVRLRLDLGYDGTDFAGWAAQPGRRTVEDTLASALGTVLRLKPIPRLVVAGRTDAGVHARGQVCHFDLPTASWEGFPGRSRRPSRRREEELLVRLAGVLPADLRVQRAALAPPGFEARFSAVRRRYSYRICDHPAGVPPLRRHDVFGHRRPLDVEAMSAAARTLVGLNDFAAFCRRRDGATTIRTLLEYSWSRDDDGFVVAAVIADAFCHSMVRALVGVVLPVGDGRRPVEWPVHVLTGAVRHPAVTVAAALGLVLEEVVYPDDAGLALRAQESRTVRTLPKTGSLGQDPAGQDHAGQDPAGPDLSDRDMAAPSGIWQRKVGASRVMSESTYQPGDDGNGPDDTLDLDQAFGDDSVDETVYDTGYSPPEQPLGMTRFGTTNAEEEQGETLDQRLAQEEPDPNLAADLEASPSDENVDSVDNTRIEDEDLSYAEVGGERAGRLVDPDEGLGEDREKDLIGSDVGIDEGAASAEEAAVHVIE